MDMDNGAGAHSLVLNFTVQSQSRPGQPQCEVQGSVDKEPFFQYDSDSNEVKPLGVLGEKVKATKTWTELPQMLQDEGKELRMILAAIKLDRNKTRGPPTLQAEASCRCEGEQCTAGPWKFSFNGKTALLFDPRSMNWTFVDPGASGNKENWEHLEEEFKKLSKGHCKCWLRKFLVHWEGVLEPTAQEFPPSLSNDPGIRDYQMAPNLYAL
ncbi:retinoic acid early transcript 1E-like [Pteronotus mesoamericanus]|uniref:retinoic acid early transcript 1E-like n=1 Tax=Pteronotus mesoamericanus TaxID=1884717 RepID=UPI0023EC9EA7|nr:retinoic acid early transcript 1E-like [Pteronotus parnellii mesoamericanus]